MSIYESRSEEKQTGGEQERYLQANNEEFNSMFGYPNNTIRTSKYNVFNFLPLNLFEQFQRLANAYFLVLLILQLIPQISSLAWYTTVIPLIVVLSITAVKDAIDDVKRHQNDNQVNNRSVLVLRNGRMEKKKWMNIEVGDIIKLENNQPVTADILLLSSSEPYSMAYIETAELDGETNLKVKQAIHVTSDMENDLNMLSAFDGEVRCDAPNNKLGRFTGILTYKGKNYLLDLDKLLLRGCVIRNTDWCYGLVIYTGPDTKLMQNSGKSSFKRTHIDHLMNILVLWIFLFLGCMCFSLAIGHCIWESKRGYYFQDILPWKDYVSSSFVSAILIFWSYFIILNTMVPISLYVSVEIIRLGNSFYINWDRKMYYALKNTPAQACTTTLNEELGQVKFLFSDKTGTLTRNIMVFSKCSINGTLYGNIYDKYGQRVEVSEDTEKVDFSYNELADSKFKFYDNTLVDAVKSGDSSVHLFFRSLALCHTVMAEEKVKGELVYQAQSPDEGALVTAARSFGFVLRSRSPETITVVEMGKTQVYHLLALLDFSNVRKRMSVIVRTPEDRIMLFCKGADTILCQLLLPSCTPLRDVTMGHLDVYIGVCFSLIDGRIKTTSICGILTDHIIKELDSTGPQEHNKDYVDRRACGVSPNPAQVHSGHIHVFQEFASEGLRTLVVAYRELDKPFFRAWYRKHSEICFASDDRENKIAGVYEEIEKDLTLLGATAIEDKLQDEVPQTIRMLNKAKIKIWVLTGDKQETAMNIAYASSIFENEMDGLFFVEGKDADTVKKELRSALNRMKPGSLMESDPINRYLAMKPKMSVRIPEEEPDGNFGLIINGFSLACALEGNLELELLRTACMCKGVICCRMTPLQKAQVVELVKKYKKVVTLAIGDGANDVSMIKAAHIGVGISGQEGMQAMLNSDFSFSQFHYLQRLLLVHGRWSYNRMCKFLSYFFYKNFAFTLLHFWYSFYSGFSAQTVYDTWFITFYNLVYTCLPVLGLSLFDQDVNETWSLRFPELYEPGQLNLYFNKKEFLKCLLHGIYSSFVLFFIPMGTIFNSVRSDGKEISDYQSFSLIVQTSLLWVVTMQIALETTYWTMINHLFTWGSLGFYFCILFFLYSDDALCVILPNVFQFLGVAKNTLNVPQLWLSIGLSVFLCVLPAIGYQFLKPLLWPLSVDKVFDTIHGMRRPLTFPVRSKLNITRSRRSAYAFSHKQGFGPLITSGMFMKSKRPKKNSPHKK